MEYKYSQDTGEITHSELEALRARIAELEAVAEKMANVLQWALDDGFLSSYRGEANASIISYEAYKSKHTAADEQKEDQ